MKKWDFKYHYEDQNEKSSITSLTYSPISDLIVAGTSTGDLLFFEVGVDGNWMNIKSSTIKGVDEKFDFYAQTFANMSIIDCDFVPIQRKCPMLLTAAQKEIKLWFISDHLEPVAPPNFAPKGLEFPAVYQSERLLTPNQITSINSQYSSNFSSLCCCPDGMTFGYCENQTVFVRRVDRIDPSLSVYISDTTLTKIDFHPNEYEIFLVGDENGKASIVDMRVQPTQKTPTLSAKSGLLLGKNSYLYINDCKFSADGTKFFTRHYSDLIFWDSRKTGSCLKKVHIQHELETDNCHITENGRDIFSSVWIDPNTVATGSFGAALFLINLDGNIISKYITPNDQKEKHKFWSTQKTKMASARKRQINAIAINQQLSKLVASNAQSLQIYDLLPF